MRRSARKSVSEPTTVDPIEVLKRVHALVKTHWAPGVLYLAADAHGRIVQVTDPKAAQFDLLGCFMRVAHDMTGSDLGASDARAMFRKANDIDTMTTWERDKGRGEILDAIERAMSWRAE